MIPRVFHRIWLDEPIPAKYEAWWNRFKDLHPGWAFVSWRSSEAVLEWIRCAAEFKAVTTWAGRADILRYEILYDFGGIYVDCDVEPLRSFEPLLAWPDGRDPFIAWEDRHALCPTVMGSPRRHSAIGALIDALPEHVAAHPDDPPNYQTGPMFVTPLLQNRPDISLLKPIAFYPVHWSRRADLGRVRYPDESYAVHHWDAGWKPGREKSRPAPLGGG